MPTITPRCPKCAGPMTKRTRASDGSQFWGCSDFPTCRGTRNVATIADTITAQSQSQAQAPDAQEQRPFAPSGYQVAIFDFVQHGSGNAVVEAAAGSGKSTTAIESLSYTPNDARVAFVAFNRHIAKELQIKLAKRNITHVRASTLHSLGLSNIRRAYPKVTIDEHKLRRITDALMEQAIREGESHAAHLIDTNRDVAIRLTNLCKALLIQPTPTNLEQIMADFTIELAEENGNPETTRQVLFKLTSHLVATSAADTSTIDFEDMIYFCAINMVPCERFDYLFVDEVQDMSQAQIEFILRSMAPGGRFIGIGDSQQAIYRFRGVGMDVMEQIVQRTNAKRLPLSITYRCPRSHVTLAQQIVPQIEAAPGAKEGIIANISKEQFLDDVKPGDLVICRTNAPLVPFALRLIARGVKAQVRGRDFGRDLLQVVRKARKRLEKKGLPSTLPDILAELSNHTTKEIAKAVSLERHSQAQMLQDQLETVIALAEDQDDISSLEERISSIFSDESGEGVDFSSVHRAKGLESDTVYILRPDLMPHPMAKTADDMRSEQNLQYISYTRSKNYLGFVF